MDLNVIVFENGFASEKMIENKLNRLIKNGYKKIALTVVIDGSDLPNVPLPLKIKYDSLRIQILHRLTMKVDETIQLYQLMKNENTKLYDLLAIEPKNEKILSYLNNGNFECDIISFTFIESLMTNPLKKANFSLPISKGIGIELNYSDCLSSSSRRRQTISCGQILVDKTNSKNIILSSGTPFLVNIKSPRDVIFIGLLFGLTEFQAKRAIYQNGTKVIKHSELRKNIISSTIQVFDHTKGVEDNVPNKRLLDENNEQSNNSLKRSKS